MSGQASGEMVRLLFVAARDQPDLWHHLKRDFAQDEEGQVILDRRGASAGSGSRAGSQSGVGPSAVASRASRKSFGTVRS